MEHHTHIAIKQLLQTPADFTLNLVEFALEGDMNDHLAGKGFPQRITCKWVSAEVLRMELRGYVQAIFTLSDRSLYKVGAMPLHWVWIQRAFKKQYEGVRIYE